MSERVSYVRVNSDRGYLLSRLMIWTAALLEHYGARRTAWRQRAGHDAAGTADDFTWLQDHDPHADWRSPAPDPTAEQAIARVERERRRR